MTNNEPKREIALLWDKDTLFMPYLTDKGFDCDLITPNLLFAPFFSFTGYKLVIVPAGFGDELYSGILKGLRASSVLIKDFVKAGGALLVSGALSNKDAYNWLPAATSLTASFYFRKARLARGPKKTPLHANARCHHAI